MLVDLEVFYLGHLKNFYTIQYNTIHLVRSTLIGRRQFRDGLKSHLFADAYFRSSENIRYKSVMYLLTYLLVTSLDPWAGFVGCFTTGTGGKERKRGREGQRER